MQSGKRVSSTARNFIHSQETSFRPLLVFAATHVFISDNHPGSSESFPVLFKPQSAAINCIIGKIVGSNIKLNVRPTLDSDALQSSNSEF